MLHFNTLSWHYKLVLYVFGKNFFLEKDKIDYDASEKLNTIIWTKKPKVVNFCPYCRGVLWSALSLPFVFLWRLLPHKPKKELTHKQTMRKMKIRGMLIRGIGGSIQFPFALANYLNGNTTIAIIQVILGIGIMATFAFLPGNETVSKIFRPLFKAISKFIDLVWPEKKSKKESPPKVKNPSIVAAYLHEKHSVICPPVCFIEKIDQEKFR